MYGVGIDKEALGKWLADCARKKQAERLMAYLFLISFIFLFSVYRY